MKIRWLGYASFLIETGKERIITDPFDERAGYAVFTETVDIATVSHEHWDHNAVGILAGKPQVIRGEGEFRLGGITITGFSSFHDQTRGRDRGKNTIYKISAEGMELLHLGDLGHILSPREIEAIGQVDILLLPVGGTYTIDARQALETMQQLNPRITIPMHYQTPHVKISLAPLEAFTGHLERVVKRPFLEITREELPEEPLVVVLDYL